MIKKIVFTLVVVFVCTAMFAQTKADSTTKKVAVKGNNELPNVDLKDVNGNTINIRSLADSGKITVISFWAIWCGPCIKELDNCKSLLPEWIEEFNIQYYAISIDDARTTVKVKPFAASRGWEYNILLDPNQELARVMNVTNPPMILIYDENGTLIYQHVGYTEGSEYDVEDQLKALKNKK